MPYQSEATLTAWLREFEELGYPNFGGARVLRQDGENDSPTGLVAVQITGSTASTFIQPSEPGASSWSITFEAREEPIQLDAADVSRMAAELETISALCEFLQAKSGAGDEKPE